MKYKPDEIIIRNDSKTGIQYHTHINRPNKPLYEKRFKEARPYSLMGFAVVKDERGCFIIDMDGDSVIGDNRFDVISVPFKIDIITWDRQKYSCKDIYQVSDFYETKLGNDSYYLLIDEGNYYLYKQSNHRYLTLRAIYFRDIALLRCSYSVEANIKKRFSSRFRNSFTDILVDVKTGTTFIGPETEEEVLRLEPTARQLPQLFYFTVHDFGRTKKQEYYALATEKFEVKYMTKEAAINSLIGFDRVRGNELIRL